jgi:hypothetical protein
MFTNKIYSKTFERLFLHGLTGVWSINRGCLLLLGTWSHLRYMQGSLLAHLFLWYVIPTCVLRLITLWYPSHFIPTTYWQLLLANIFDKSDIQKYKRLLTTFSLSNHSLNIGIGKHRNIIKSNRLCTCCNLQDIEDEFLFILNCPLRRSSLPLLKTKIDSTLPFQHSWIQREREREREREYPNI